jgi:hypothetical protein
VIGAAGKIARAYETGSAKSNDRLAENPSFVQRNEINGTPMLIGITAITVTPISRPVVKMQSNFFGSASCQRL